MKTQTSRAAAVAAASVAVAMIAPATSSAHTTISAIQPQGPSLTAARTTYVVRAPNETPTQNTFKVVMRVPKELRRVISVKQNSDWDIRLTKSGTGEIDAEGNEVQEIKRISWLADSERDEIRPSEFGEFGVRFVNPATAGRLCVAFKQYYRNERGSRKNPEIVAWDGPSGSARPASCITVVDK